MGSYLVYGQVVLPVTELLAFDRKAVYDGPSLLYHRVFIHVRSIYNPAAVSYVPDPLYDPYIFPKAQAGAYPAATDKAIRFELMQPRKLLLWVVGGNVTLQSPAFRPPPAGFGGAGTLYPCDAHLGPTPLGNPIVEQIGRKSFIVDFMVETFVNDSWTQARVAPVVLSHRWTRREDIDQDFYPTITTHGHAIFRTDVLSYYQKYAGNGAVTAAPNYADRISPTMAVPDDFRNFFFHSVPSGFKRDHASISPSEDGTMCEYTLVDRKVDVKFPSTIARIEAWLTIGTATGAGMNFLMGVYNKIKGPTGPSDQNILQDRDRDLADLDKKSNWNPAKWWGVAQQHVATGAARVGNWAAGADKNQLFDFGTNAALGLDDLMKGRLIPMMNVSLSINVFGDPSATMDTLKNTAYTLAIERLDAIGTFIGVVTAASTDINARQNLTARFFSLTASKRLPYPSKVKMRGLGFSALPDLSPMLPEIGVNSSVLLAPNPGTEIPNNNRAYYAESLAAQLFLTDFMGTESPANRALPQAQNLP